MERNEGALAREDKPRIKTTQVNRREQSSSLWPRIKQFYSTILDYTSWTVGTSTLLISKMINGVLLLLYQIL